MAILTAGNDAIDMREPDWGLTPVGDASAFLDAFDPVRTDVIENTATSFTYNSYDSRNNLVILKGTGNVPLGSLNSLTVEVPLYSVRLIYSGSMIIDPWGNISGSITGISAYLTSDNRLLGQMTGINVPWDSSDLDSLTNPVILGGSDTLTGSPQADYLLGFGGDDLLQGMGGNDNLEGWGGRDTLDGGPGADTMAGGNGDDLYWVDNPGDVVTEKQLPGREWDTQRVSVSTNGMQANYFSSAPSISGDGRYVAFISGASNLVEGDTNYFTDIFRKDTQTGEVLRVNVSATGTQADSSSDSPSISADGRYVAFASNADNLIAGDANVSRQGIFVKDLATGEVMLANWPGVSANAGSYQPALSGNGRFVAFESDATNLVDGDVNGARDIFVRNLDLDASPQPINPGNILVMLENNIVGEYTRTGSLVQQFSVPVVNTWDLQRLDAVVDDHGRVHFYNGSYSPYLTTYDSETARFENHTFPGWNGSGGGIGLFADAVYVTDEAVSHDASGIIRFSLTDFSAQRFAEGQSYQDLTVGLDGFLYALNDSQPATTIDVYDPVSQLLVKTINLSGDLRGADIRGIAVNTAGLIYGYGAGWNGTIYKFDSNGAILSSLQVGPNLSDIDISAQGELITADWFRNVYTTTTDLAGYSSFSVTVGDSYMPHVAFTDAAPEPTSPAPSPSILCASTSAAGAPANGNSFNPAISADGRYVTFESIATNLVAGDGNGTKDIFVKDLQTGAIWCVSTDAQGAFGNGTSSSPDITADGRYVVFESSAPNLVPGDSNGAIDVFIKDIQTGAIRRVSSDALGAGGNAQSDSARISADGHFVTFRSAATNLVPDDTNGRTDIFVKDLLTGEIQLLTGNASGAQTLVDSYRPDLTSDGRKIAYESGASNLVSGDSNNAVDVFLVTNTLGLPSTGFDRVLASISYTLPDAVESLQLTGSLAINGTGNALDNTLVGNAGANRLTGGAGNDTLDGGAGLDTALFSGSKAVYTLTRTSSGMTAASAADGTDALINIERLQFTDKTLAFDLDGNAGQAYRLYQAAFDRVPDQGGLGYWIDQMDSGTGLSQVATGFINSAEFKALYGNNPSNAEFVTLLYDNVLHRAPDTGGYDFWMNELSHGVSREQVLTGFSESTENKVALMAFDMDGNMGKDYRLYQAAFDRQPDVSGLDYWYHQMNSGVTLQQVASGFINSAEFKALYGNNPSNAEFVTLLYDNVLHRAPDTGGFNFWMNDLDQGTSREQVLIGFSESLENQLSLVGIVQTGIEFI